MPVLPPVPPPVLFAFAFFVRVRVDLQLDIFKVNYQEPVYIKGELTEFTDLEPLLPSDPSKGLEEYLKMALLAIELKRRWQLEVCNAEEIPF